MQIGGTRSYSYVMGQINFFNIKNI
jgi:hypothetical protein